jgi:hypothetical protein
LPAAGGIRPDDVYVGLPGPLERDVRPVHGPPFAMPVISHQPQFLQRDQSAHHLALQE